LQALPKVDQESTGFAPIEVLLLWEVKGVRKLTFTAISLLILLALVSCDDMGFTTEYRVEAYTTNRTIFHHRPGSYFETMGSNFYTATGEMIKVSTSLFQTDPKFSYCRQIVPDSLIVEASSSLSFSSDGAWVYFAANGDIYRVSPDGAELQRIAESQDMVFANPKISGDDRYLSFIDITNTLAPVICVKDLQTGTIYEHANGTSKAKSAVFLSSSQRIYYVNNTGLWSIALSDSSSTQEIQFSPDGRLHLTTDGRFIVASSIRNRDYHRVYFFDLEYASFTYKDVLDYSVARNAPVIITPNWDRATYYNYDTGTERVAYSKEIEGKAPQTIGKVAVSWDGEKVYLRAEY
jgi:hypothetical protein